MRTATGSIICAAVLLVTGSAKGSTVTLYEWTWNSGGLGAEWVDSGYVSVTDHVSLIEVDGSPAEIWTDITLPWNAHTLEFTYQIDGNPQGQRVPETAPPDAFEAYLGGFAPGEAAPSFALLRNEADDLPDYFNAGNGETGVPMYDPAHTSVIGDTVRLDLTSLHLPRKARLRFVASGFGEGVGNEVYLIARLDNLRILGTESLEAIPEPLSVVTVGWACGAIGAYALRRRRR
jgi:hypothetical protein